MLDIHMYYRNNAADKQKLQIIIIREMKPFVKNKLFI